jgi:HD-like signal output (HDOD) protein
MATHILPAVPDKFRSIIDGLGQVPTLPAIVARALEILNQPNASAESAARLIGQDLALSAKVLRLANSAFYGIPRSIASVDQAIVILGFQTVRSLVMSASVLKILGKGGKSSLDRKMVWRHSVATALASRIVVRKVGRRLGLDIEAAFMASLLHKIGVLILDGAEHAEYNMILEEAALEDAQPLPLLERKHLQIDHAALGGMLAEKWGLPEELRDPIAHHLSPATAPTQGELAAVVQLSSYLAESVGFGAFEGLVQWPLDPNVFTILQFEPTLIPDLCESLKVELEKAESFFALIESST